MPVERAPGGTSLIDVLDRVLDKGIVVDAWVRVSLVGIDLITVEARVVVASIDTYLRYAEAMGITAPVARPPISVSTREELQPGEEVSLSVGREGVSARLGTPGAKEETGRGRGRGRGAE